MSDEVKRHKDPITGKTVAIKVFAYSVGAAIFVAADQLTGVFGGHLIDLFTGH